MTLGFCFKVISIQELLSIGWFRKEIHMFITTPPWAYQRSYTTNKKFYGEEIDSNYSDVVVVLEDPEVGNGDPSYFVVLNALTLLGHEARPCSPLSLLLGVQETRIVLAIILNSKFL